MKETTVFQYSGNLIDVVNSFISTMEEVTGKKVDVDISISGEVTIDYLDKPKVEKRPEINYDVLFRGDYINEVFDTSLPDSF